MIAKAMHAKLKKKRKRYVAPGETATITHKKRGAVVAILKYLGYSGKVDRTVSVQWQVNGQYLEISCSGTTIVIADIDIDFAEAIANVMRIGLPHVESTFAPTQPLKSHIV